MTQNGRDIFNAAFEVKQFENERCKELFNILNYEKSKHNLMTYLGTGILI